MISKEKERAAVYKVMNTIIPRGNGKCALCRPGKPCYGCSPKIRGLGECSRCDGTGVDKHGLHCTNCANNYDEWGKGENAFKMRDLYQSIASGLFDRR